MSKPTAVDGILYNGKKSNIEFHFVRFSNTLMFMYYNIRNQIGTVHFQQPMSES